MNVQTSQTFSCLCSSQCLVQPALLDCMCGLQTLSGRLLPLGLESEGGARAVPPTAAGPAIHPAASKPTWKQ